MLLSEFNLLSHNLNKPFNQVSRPQLVSTRNRAQTAKRLAREHWQAGPVTRGRHQDEPGGAGAPAAARSIRRTPAAPPGGHGGPLTWPTPPETGPVRPQVPRGPPRAHGLGPVSLRVRPTHPFLRVRVAAWRKCRRAPWLFWELFILSWGIND